MPATSVVREYFTFAPGGAGYVTPQAFSEAARRGKIKGVIVRSNTGATVTTFDLYIYDTSRNTGTSKPKAESTFYGITGVASSASATDASLADQCDNIYTTTAAGSLGITLNIAAGAGTMYVAVDLEPWGSV